MKALIIGAARSGSACAKMLHDNGYEVYLTDYAKVENKEELEKEGIIVYDGGHPDLLKEINYDLIVKNPGIKETVPFVKYFKDAGYRLYTEIDVAASIATNYRFGAVTGTNGKTTTTTLLSEFLKCNNPLSSYAGNIGLPLACVYNEKGNVKLDIALELSSFQCLGIYNLHPVVSVITNLTLDHADFHGSADNYYKAKLNVYKNQSGDDWFLLNIDDETVMSYVKDVNCKIVTYSIKQKADLYLDGRDVKLFDELLFNLDDLHIPGPHNLQNAMVAACMAYKMGVSVADIRKVLNNFNGVEHRLEFVREIEGVRYYNDSKGTNPDSTVVALNSFDNNVILLAGGYDKKTGFDAIKPYLGHVKRMYVFGETKYQIKDIYPEAIVCETMEEATKLAHESAISGDTVLLSPMCASWDQFTCFEQRGEIFANIVREF